MVKKKSLGSTGSKYSKVQVMRLKDIFEKHDLDRSGEVSIAELVRSMAGTNLEKQSEGMFKALDKDQSGKITFDEYLQVYYPHANNAERETMMSWCYPNKAPPKEEAKVLTAEQIEEITSLFILYDTDKSGNLSRFELVEAMVNSGYDEDEVEDLFELYDTDNANAITLEEFVKLMESSYL